jgi:hypothetical protein
LVTWSELANIHRYAAEHLLDERDDNLYRASCTQAYYSAYAAITERLPAGTVFTHGWQNPAHAALPGLIGNVAGLSESKKDAIRVALGRLRQRRENADYRPKMLVNRTSARESRRDLATIMALLP